MKKEIVSDSGTNIYYEENFWTGKKTIKINNLILNKVKRNVYTDGTRNYTLKGSYFTGVTLSTDEYTFTIYEKLSLFECILGFFPWIMVIIGGAIGAVFGVLASFVTISVIRSSKNVFVNIVTSIAATLVAFGLWFVVAMILLA